MLVASGEGAVTAWSEEEQLGLLLQDNLLIDSAGAGLFLDQSSATLSGNTYENNGMDLIRQGCGQTDSPEGLEDEPLDTLSECGDYDLRLRELSYQVYLSEPGIDP